MADVSIIIPTLNEEVGIITFLTKLQPLRPQCELIVVDGGSDDETVSLAEPYVDDVVQASKGRAIQMNVGAAMASSPIVLFLHSDTYLPKDGINYILHAINQGYDWGRFDIQLSGKHKMLSVVAWLMNQRSRWTGIATGDQAIFVNKSVFDHIGGFSDIALMEDIDLSAKLKQGSKPFCLKYKVTSSGRRWISFGVLKTILLMWWLRLRYHFGAQASELEVLYRKGKFWKD